MEITIINQRKTFKLYGFSKLHEHNKPYSETIFELLDQVWKEVKNKELSHTGINHVLYDADNIIFAGIELISAQEPDSLLEKRDVNFQIYAYFKHIGPYSELNEINRSIQSTIKALGEHHEAPVLEIYGHWNDDESKLETEILYNLK
jgi:predicted transcriptional regulator YdeE